MGSASELKTQLIIAKELLLAEKSLVVETEGLLIEVLKILNRMISNRENGI